LKKICLGVVELGSYIFSDLELLVEGKFFLCFLDIGLFNVFKGFKVLGFIELLTTFQN
jgi:hypothetical protein